MNPSVTPEFVHAHPEKDWHWGQYGLSINNMKIAQQKHQRIVERTRCYHVVDQLCDVFDVNRYISEFL
jgi:hypothetical protein